MIVGFFTNYKFNIIRIKLNMLKSLVNCMKIKCETNSFGSGIVVVFRSCHQYLYRYCILAVSISIGWCLYRYCTDTDCIVPALFHMCSHECNWFSCIRGADTWCWVLQVWCGGGEEAAADGPAQSAQRPGQSVSGLISCNTKHGAVSIRVEMV